MNSFFGGCLGGGGSIKPGLSLPFPFIFFAYGSYLGISLREGSGPSWNHFFRNLKDLKDREAEELLNLPDCFSNVHLSRVDSRSWVLRSSGTFSCRFFLCLFDLII